MYPDIEPYDSGVLRVEGDHEIYWECSGNPNGKPALYLHGGPGSGSSPSVRRYFDPHAYRTVLLDQRGCGRSRPLVKSKDDLETNTTQDLVDDIESLRRHLSIERWVVLGGSWGSTLALAYAQAHPERVSALVLANVTTTSRKEVDWLTYGVRVVFPTQWERFSAHVPEHLKDVPIVEAYTALLFDEDANVCASAAQEWCAWEDAHVSLTPGHAPNRRFADLEFRLRFSRIVTHYWRHAAFLKEGRLLEDMGLLHAIPGTLIHGMHDVSSPPEVAREVNRRWAGSRLHLIADAGHGGGSMPNAIVSTLDGLRA